MKNLTHIFLLILVAGNVYSQDIHHRQQDVDSVNHGSFNPNEAKNIDEWFHKGDVSGVIRSIGMTTINEGSLSDYYALAVGGRLYYHTAYLKGIQLGLGGLYIYNIASSDLSVEDSQVHKLAKWERQLFDITDPHNKADLDRLEELFIKYRYKDSYIKYGKMAINTPLVNAQDSRMKPTVLNGFWFDWNEGHKFEINGGYFSKISPRSTTEWYRMDEAIGIYNTGYNPDGTESEYHENIETNGLLILGGHVKPVPQISIDLWQYHILNVLQTTFFQGELNKDMFSLGLQYIYQSPKGNGGSEVYNMKYFHDDNIVNLISGNAELHLGKVKLAASNTATLGDGRFTFPREFGTANLYTFISLHRVEGLGKFNSQSLKFNFLPIKDKDIFDVGIYFVHTNVNSSVEFNKYKIVSTNQMNVDFKLNLEEKIKGLDIRLLSVFNRSKHPLTTDPLYVFNKTNYIHTNFMINYKF